MPPPSRRRVALVRALSKIGAASRSEARTLISGGRVSVNGRVVTDLMHPVVPETARIEIDGEAVTRKTTWRTVLFHKPRGVVTTRRDPEGRRTVFDVLGPAGHGLVAAGRLDLATTGLLVLTNDTQLAHALTDPGNAIIRTYVVTVRGAMADEAAQRMTRGIGGMKAEAIEIRKRSARETHLVVQLAEGKNREIRRLCEAVGHEVTRLKRVAFGGLELGDLEPGAWREVTREEVARAVPAIRSRG